MPPVPTRMLVAGPLAVMYAVMCATIATGCAAPRQPPASQKSAAAPVESSAPSGGSARPYTGEAVRSIVRVTGTAHACDRDVEGTGFVYARERVMLTAHTVAGADRNLKVSLADGRGFDAEVVVFDPLVDIAVLLVEGLPSPSLPLQVKRESSATVIGYEEGGTTPSVQPAIVGDRVPAESRGIYDDQLVEFDSYSFRGPRVWRGMSGAPLVSRDERVLGMVFAADTDLEDKGYALTARQLSTAAKAGRHATAPVSTEGCA
ncbi:trypsin-like peptidase domain-containing protein [Microtetraspora malaysiensis]|uniref:trypsin-like peptidase domain-containing protein n=1 Tax=Microtetraspora malaysiensis TaxID=161358 RepID=UPI003D90443F